MRCYRNSTVPLQSVYDVFNEATQYIYQDFLL